MYPEEDAAFVLRSLRYLVHRLRASSHSIVRATGLTGAQVFILGEIAAAERMAIRELADRALTDPSSASTMVARLVSRGLVVRRRDPADGRRRILSVTPKGRSLLRRAPIPYQAKLFEALRALPAKRLHELRLGLEALAGPAAAMERRVPLFFEDGSGTRESS